MQKAGPVPGLAARQAAARLIDLVVVKRHSLDGLTDESGGNPAYLALEGRDRALARAIVKVALRHRNAFARTLARLIERPLPASASAVSDILHVGLAQILVLDVPDRAAVDMAVHAAKADRSTAGHAGLVNAVLRRIAGEGRAEAMADLAAEGPFAPWFADALTAAWGKAEAGAMAAICRHEAPLDLAVKGEATDWAERLGGTSLMPGHVRLPAGPRDVTALEGFDGGAWFVQDIAAAVPAQLLRAAPGKTVADLCAAPGGKTARLVMTGADVTAFESHPGRAKRLAANLARLDLACPVVIGDFREAAGTRSFDAVLLDAPCSSTGTVRRHPDVSWVKTPAQVTALAALQRELLLAALPLVAPGGVLVHSNCSLLPEEGEAMISGLRDSGRLAEAGFVIEPVLADELGPLAQAATADGWVRTRPDMLAADDPAVAGLDGFFAVRLRRKT